MKQKQNNLKTRN